MKYAGLAVFLPNLKGFPSPRGLTVQLFNHMLHRTPDIRDKAPRAPRAHGRGLPHHRPEHDRGARRKPAGRPCFDPAGNRPRARRPLPRVSCLRRIRHRRRHRRTSPTNSTTCRRNRRPPPRPSRWSASLRHPRTRADSAGGPGRADRAGRPGRADAPRRPRPPRSPLRAPGGAPEPRNLSYRSHHLSLPPKRDPRAVA